MDLAAIHKIESELSARGSQNEDVNKRTSAVFPIKVFRMRSSILTELLEVSHIRSIRQIFIAILVIVVLQVAITDLFELGT
jgi:sterol O-acyltransferase